MHTKAERFEELYLQFGEPIMRYALRRVGPDRADDIVTECFLIAWRRLDDISEEVPLLWLYGVARNLIRNEQRKIAIGQVAVGVAEQLPGTDAIASIATGLDLRKALEKLSFDDAEVLRLTAWEGLTPGEAAVVLRCSSATFRVRLHRARAHLRLLFDDEPKRVPRNGCPDLRGPVLSDE